MCELDVLVVPEHIYSMEKLIRDYSTEPPKMQAEDDWIIIAKDVGSTLNYADDKLTIAETSGLSKETTEEIKAESSSDADTNPSDQDPVIEATLQDETASGNGCATSVRSFHVLAVPPQDLFFIAPPGFKPGQLLSVQGPLGPLQVQAPADVKPGNHITVRLAAPFQHKVIVPAGAKPGDAVTFKGESGNELQVIVPRGKKPGQAFLVSPPVTMLQIPYGAVAGDQLLFYLPIGFGKDASKQLAATVPPNMVPGQYFAAMVSEVPQAPAQNGSEMAKV